MLRPTTLLLLSFCLILARAQEEVQNFTKQSIRTQDGKCLSATSIFDGTPVTVQPCDDSSSNQTWDGVVKGANVVTEGFMLLVLSGSKSCLDVEASEGHPGMYRCGNGAGEAVIESQYQIFADLLGRDGNPGVLIPRSAYVNNGQDPGQKCLTVVQDGLELSSCDAAQPLPAQIFMLNSPPLPPPVRKRSVSPMEIAIPAVFFLVALAVVLSIYRHRTSRARKNRRQTSKRRSRSSSQMDGRRSRSKSSSRRSLSHVEHVEHVAPTHRLTFTRARAVSFGDPLAEEDHKPPSFKEVQEISRNEIEIQEIERPSTHSWPQSPPSAYSEDNRFSIVQVRKVSSESPHRRSMTGSLVPPASIPFASSQPRTISWVPVVDSGPPVSQPLSAVIQEATEGGTLSRGDTERDRKRSWPLTRPVRSAERLTVARASLRSIGALTYPRESSRDARQNAPASSSVDHISSPDTLTASLYPAVTEREAPSPSGTATRLGEAMLSSSQTDEGSDEPQAGSGSTTTPATPNPFYSDAETRAYATASKPSPNPPRLNTPVGLSSNVEIDDLISYFGGSLDESSFARSVDSESQYSQGGRGNNGRQAKASGSGV